MTTQTAQSIDPSATIDPTASIADDVVIEADAVIGPNVTIGPGGRVRTRAMVIENTTIGARCDIHPYAIVGNDPQDLAYDPGTNRGTLIIGDDVCIREFVTIGRSTGDGPPTRIGNNCFLMSQSHLGHNGQLGNQVILSNGASVAGYATVGDRCVLSGFCMVHQFCDIGEMVMFRAGMSTSMHIPPFVILGMGNCVSSLNTVGLRRAGLSASEREQIKRAFKAIYRDRGGKGIRSVIDTLNQEAWSGPARHFIDFIDERLDLDRPRNRGICPGFTTSTRPGGGGD